VTIRIAIFGLFGSFDYYQIGGLESISRRIANGLIQKGHQVDFVTYGAPATTHTVTESGIGIDAFATLQEALDNLIHKYEHVLTMYLRPLDRLRFLMFRQRNNRRLSFHQVFFNWPDSPWKRKAACLDARLYPFNGRLFCISPRIFHDVRQWSNQALLMLPPIPESYFIDPVDKPKKDKLRVTYIGRTEPGKGIEDVISLVTSLQSHPEIEFEIHGFHHKHLEVSVRIHEWLSRQKELQYFYTPFEGYSPHVETELRNILKYTDILLLPYRKLSSTIDMPVLLLEGMASLCAILTRPLGDIPEIYGASCLLLPEPAAAGPIILESQGFLEEERQRIQRRNQELGFGLDHILNQFIQAIA
jgi:glycosyltransferase involved in cell wall biosynthesis